MLLASLTAFIPAPPFNQIGPLHLYGLCIALGVVAAVTLSSRRWEARGGDPDDIATIALWAVPAGVIGSRIYHVATDWKRYQDHWIDAFKITQGGLGIPGGIFFGVLTGVLVARSKHLRLPPLFDVVAPAIPIAQAIGRFGNYFNQEVFGRPTKVPWALEVDPEFRPVRYIEDATFHPTFLYEGLWNVALAFLLIRLDRKRRIRPGQLFTLYILGYAVGRLWVEMLRSDEASLVLGIRINIWMSVIVGLIALLVFVMAWRLGPGDPAAHMATDEAAAALGMGVDGQVGDGEAIVAPTDCFPDLPPDSDGPAADLEDALEEDALFVEDDPPDDEPG
ncbi:MAG: prolipoprotein diacylglyceryl transferase [Aquihabitans sp.]